MSIEQAIKALASARSALFITGAGISAASGVPTYRGIGGLYNDEHPEEGLSIEMALSGPMLTLEPAITWKYIHQIERACRGATFNAAHAALARLEPRFERAWVLTQNVDGFHRAAGSKNVIDIHGDTHRLYCTRCDYDRTVASYEGLPDVPKCPRCGALVRPDVVLFGEALPPAKVDTLLRELGRGFDVVVSIGTSSLFPYITSPVLQAAQRGATTIEINPEDTSVTAAVAIKLRLPAVEALSAIVAGLEGAPA
ncbi:MAG TPA: NAD-dependent deacylase [Polyangiaceae bacterium]|nr:NAD-dependent deacylase [Polyangiaceae bacterium]